MQMQAMQQEMQQMAAMLQNVQQSIEAREVQVKEFEAQIRAYDAETKRISTVQASMSPEQIQDIVMGTLAAAIDSGDIVAGGMPREMENPMENQAEGGVEEPGYEMR